MQPDTASKAEENVEEEVMENILTTNNYYLVDIEKLKVLFDRCKICGNVANIKRSVTKGTMVTFKVKWKDHYTNRSSQFTKQRICEGNMLLSAAILLPELTYEPFHKVMNISGIQFLGKSPFTLRRKFLFPSKKREIITNCNW